MGVVGITVPSTVVGPLFYACTVPVFRLVQSHTGTLLWSRRYGERKTTPEVSLHVTLSPHR